GEVQATCVNGAKGVSRGERFGHRGQAPFWGAGRAWRLALNVLYLFQRESNVSNRKFAAPSRARREAAGAPKRSLP
ncbi:MAG: hypothetical protein AAF192_05045, partial [Pseudomonadota bacterium]